MERCRILLYRGCGNESAAVDADLKNSCRRISPRGFDLQVKGVIFLSGKIVDPESLPVVFHFCDADPLSVAFRLYRIIPDTLRRNNIWRDCVKIRVEDDFQRGTADSVRETNRQVLRQSGIGFGNPDAVSLPGTVFRIQHIFRLERKLFRQQAETIVFIVTRIFYLFVASGQITFLKCDPDLLCSRQTDGAAGILFHFRIEAEFDFMNSARNYAVGSRNGDFAGNIAGVFPADQFRMNFFRFGSGVFQQKKCAFQKIFRVEEELNYLCIEELRYLLYRMDPSGYSVCLTISFSHII